MFVPTQPTKDVRSCWGRLELRFLASRAYAKPEALYMIIRCILASRFSRLACPQINRSTERFPSKSTTTAETDARKPNSLGELETGFSAHHLMRLVPCRDMRQARLASSVDNLPLPSNAETNVSARWLKLDLL